MSEFQDKTKRLNIELPAPLHRRLKIKAAAEGTSMTSLIIRMLDHLLQKTPCAQEQASGNSEEP